MRKQSLVLTNIYFYIHPLILTSLLKQSIQSMGKGSARDSNIRIKKAEEDEEQYSNSRSSQNQVESLTKVRTGIKKEVDKNYQKKPQKKRQPSPSSSSGSSDSETSSSDDDHQSVEKKIPKSIKGLLDIQASSSSGESQEVQSQFDPGENAEQKRKEYQDKYNRLYKQTTKTRTQQLIDKIADKSEEQIQQYYKTMAKQKDFQDSQQMTDCYRTQADQELYQIKCEKGKEEQLVIHILNKAKYVHEHPEHFFCKVTSAMALPKKFPGYIFLEGQDLQTIRKSIQNFKGITLTTLKKIEFQIYSHLFDEAYHRINDFKLQQYVKVKCGAYKDDLGQITQINKNGVVLKLIPRISFDLIDLRMREMDELRGSQEENHIFKKKNQILKRLTSPKVTYKTGELPPKKKLTQSDFFKYNEFPHNKNIKITEGGLILASYSFNQIGCPQTTVSANEILQLNFQTDNPQKILQKQAKHVKMQRDIRPNELVEIIAGELKGIYGRVYERTNKLVRIICLNSDIKGSIIDQLLQNLQKKFYQGERVVIIQGTHKGEEGIVYQRSKHSVAVLTDNNERLECLKRNLQSYTEGKIKFQNDLGATLNSLVKVNNQLGIICSVKKTYIQYINTKNQLLRAKNGEFQILKKPISACKSKDNKQIKRNSLVQVVEGQKSNQIFRVKHIYKEYLFLEDNNTLNLYGNWVQKGERCLLHIKSTPKSHPQFLNNRFRNRPEFFNQKNRFSKQMDDQQDEFKVGNPYRLLQGVYNGIKGVIVSTFKDYIQVRVLRDKIVRVSREELKGKQSAVDHDRRSEGSVQSNRGKNKGSRI